MLHISYSVWVYGMLGFCRKCRWGGGRDGGFEVVGATGGGLQSDFCVLLDSPWRLAKCLLLRRGASFSIAS